MIENETISDWAVVVEDNYLVTSMNPAIMGFCCMENPRMVTK